MRFFKITATFLILLGLAGQVQSAEKIYIADKRELVNIDFKDLELNDFIKIVSNILNKNILIKNKIPGKVEFLSTTPVYKDNILSILISSLEEKGYTIIDKGAFMEIVRSSEASQHNLPVLVKDNKEYKQMITDIFHVTGENVDIIASKIRHLLSRAAKLVTVKENNTILITDYPENIKTIKSIVRVIEKNANKIIVFVELKNVKAQSILNELNQIAREKFNQRIDNEKITIVQNKSNNAIIVVANEQNANEMRKIIEKMDSKSEETLMSTRIIQLKNSNVKNVFNVLNSIISKKQYTDPKDRPNISAEESTNSLIIIAKKEELEELDPIIKALDEEKQQVYVRARIIEISENESLKVGAKYGLEGGEVASTGLYTFAASVGGSSMAISNTLASFIKPETVKSGVAFGAAIDFLANQGAANIVSEPSILCIDNKDSTIYVGQTQSIITSSTNPNNTTDLSRNTYKREDIGLTLKIKPRISNDNKVTLEIEAKLEDVLDGSGAQSGTPTTTKREVKTLAIVKNGENVIVGGLIKNKISENEAKIPLLGDIPILGEAFKSKNAVEDKINLVISLTPFIIEKSADLSSLRDKLSELDAIQQEYSRKVEQKLKEKAEVKE